MAKTVGRTRFTLQTLIDRAIGRCKIPKQLITAEHQLIAKQNLSLVFADIANETVPLWCIERLLLPLYVNQTFIELPQGSIDLLPDSVFYRLLTRLDGTYSGEGVPSYAGDGDFETAAIGSSTDGSITLEFSSPTNPTQIGILPYGDNFWNLVFSYSTDGVTFTPFQTIAPPFGEQATQYLDGQWVWYELTTPPAVTPSHIRVSETSGGVLSLREFYVGNNPTDMEISRLNREQYLTLPNKNFNGGGRPLQFWLERDTDPETGEICRIIPWPIPGVNSKFAQIMCARSRYIADIQDYNQGVELPTRWYDACLWKLASYVAAEATEVQQEREIYLTAKADTEFKEALDEERDNSPINIQADISAYTR